MAEETTVVKLLDEMALKIMMVEPGDLLVVGEMVLLLESLVTTLDNVGDSPNLIDMATAFRSELDKIIMTELADSQENFDLLGKAIGLLQEVSRKNGVDPEGTASFKEILALLQPSSLVSPDVEMSGSEPEPELDPEPVVVSSPKMVAPEAPIILGEPPISTEFMEDMELLNGFIEETVEHLDSIEVHVLDLEDNPGDLDIINNIFRPFHTIKGVAGFLNLSNIQALAHSTENLLDDVRNNKREMDSNVIEVVLKVGDCLKMMAENLRNVVDGGLEQYKNYDISNYISWVKCVQSGEPEVGHEVPAETLVPARPVSKVVTATKPSATSSVSSPPSASRKVATSKKKTRVGATIKVDVEKLDGLVNAVGELVIMQTMVRANPLVASLADPKLNKDFGQLFRITSDLQKTAMSMRMVPIRQTFQKMIRLVRDLSKKTGKQANLVMEGEDTEIDRNMVDSIYDPLVHMMRNSVDHGVRLPEERERLGKPRYGTVNLRAYQKGGYMVIEIEDDGQGLDTVTIRRKAIERGLIQESDNLSDHELNNLVFLPGFSTVDKITDVSGRGVGMDVVKKAVEKLRGKVDVVSEVGKGSIFTIRLPLTLAIIDGIIVRVGAERYVIPTISIRESFKPRMEDYKTVKGRGEALLVRNNLVPIARLYKLFNVEAATTDICEAIVVVVESEGRQRAIMVDELLGKQEVVIKNLGGLTDIGGVAGGTILGDGRVGLILDLAGLVESQITYKIDQPDIKADSEMNSDEADKVSEFVKDDV